jgi:hypothetical protein
VNRIGAWIRGPEIGLLVNGEEIGRVQSDANQDGRGLLGVGQRDNGAAEARFANLVVYSLAED